MTTSNSWAFQLRKPVPDQIGFSYYLYQWEKNGPSTKPIPWQYHWLRRAVVENVLRRKAFCHELQLEPWGPCGNEQLEPEQHHELMGRERIAKHLDYARKTGVETIDLWGLEWWYWRKEACDDDSIWNTVKGNLGKP